MTFFLDLSKISNKDEFYDMMEYRLALPQYFGRNLDALSDVLEEFHGDDRFVFLNFGALRQADPQFAKRLENFCRVCADDEDIDLIIEE